MLAHVTTHKCVDAGMLRSMIEDLSSTQMFASNEFHSLLCLFRTLHPLTSVST